MSDQQLIIGLGTGRCGTVSLASFLNAQSNTRVIHEGTIGGKHHLFHWNGGSDEVITWLETLRQHLRKQRFGDVAYYFLPHVEVILERWPDAKFVVLKRERSATVESYLHKTRGLNHWMDHNGSEWWFDPVYDPTYPTLDAPSKKAAVERYWDLYYHRIDTLLTTYPDAFTLHNMHDLNSLEGRREILSFLGYKADEMVLSGSYRENTAMQNVMPSLWHRLRRTLRRAITELPFMSGGRPHRS